MNKSIYRLQLASASFTNTVDGYSTDWFQNHCMQTWTYGWRIARHTMSMLWLGWTISLSCPRNHSKWLKNSRKQGITNSKELAYPNTILGQPTLVQGWQLHLLWDPCQDLHHLHHRQDWETHGMVTKIQTTLWSSTKHHSGTRTTLVVQDDHWKPELVSYSWTLQHLPLSLNHGTVQNGTIRRTPTCYKACKVHSWLPMSLSEDLYLLQCMDTWLQHVLDTNLQLVLQLPRSKQSTTSLGPVIQSKKQLMEKICVN